MRSPAGPSRRALAARACSPAGADGPSTARSHVGVACASGLRARSCRSVLAPPDKRARRGQALDKLMNPHPDFYGSWARNNPDCLAKSVVTMPAVKVIQLMMVSRKRPPLRPMQGWRNAIACLRVVRFLVRDCGSADVCAGLCRRLSRPARCCS